MQIGFAYKYSGFAKIGIHSEGGRDGVVVLSSPFTSGVPGSNPGRVCGLGFPPGIYLGFLFIYYLFINQIQQRSSRQLQVGINILHVYK